MAQLAGALSSNRKVAGSIPSPGRQLIRAFLLHSCFSFSLPLSLKAMKTCPQVSIKKKKKSHRVFYLVATFEKNNVLEFVLSGWGNCTSMYVSVHKREK